MSHRFVFSRSTLGRPRGWVFRLRLGPCWNGYVHRTANGSTVRGACFFLAYRVKPTSWRNTHSRRRPLLQIGFTMNGNGVPYTHH